MGIQDIPPALGAHAIILRRAAPEKSDLVRLRTMNSPGMTILSGAMERIYEQPVLPAIGPYRVPQSPSVVASAM
jgi:hypothetical protein